MRSFRSDRGGLAACYRLEAAPGFRFVWAAHMLLDVSETGRLVVEPGTTSRVWPDHWRSAEPVPVVEGPWPSPLGAPLDGLTSDASALFFMLLGPGPVTVADGAQLTLRLRAEGQPAAIAIWRNLGGWPEASPYRSIGVEPAIGHHYDRDLAAAGDVGIVTETGVAEWELEISEAQP
ncbi:MAG: hypothetical protein IT337_06180 [Thermomicrobiales bacterium]|nr:hypothetical protein [Thermomicrobiales bacterium]